MWLTGVVQHHPACLLQLLFWSSVLHGLQFCTLLSSWFYYNLSCPIKDFNIGHWFIFLSNFVFIDFSWLCLLKFCYLYHLIYFIDIFYLAIVISLSHPILLQIMFSGTKSIWLVLLFCVSSTGQYSPGWLFTLYLPTSEITNRYVLYDAWLWWKVLMRFHHDS